MSKIRPAPGHTEPHEGSEPTFSVVVASCRDLALLRSCLASLAGQCQDRGAELVVARAGRPEELVELRRAYPEVHFVECPADADVPRLRAAGMLATSGDIVALTEDHCVAAPDWLAQLSTGRADIVGGTMENAQQAHAVDWGAYFSEYGFFANGAEVQGVPLLTGANVAYRRPLVDQVASWAHAGEWENVVHARLQQSGRTLQFLRSAAIAQNQNYTFRAFCLDRYRHGYAFARRRLSVEAGSKVWLFLAGGVLLPFILTLRVARATPSARRGAFVHALPFTFAFLTAWVVGEMVGYCHGPDEVAAAHG